MSFTPEQIEQLKAKLDGSYVKPPPQGKYGSYIEGWRVIAEANRIFGFDGWSYRVDRLEQTNTLYLDAKQMYHVGYLALVTIEAGGVSRQDVGHGQGFSKSEGDAHDSAIKEAVTDGLKRALRTFGNQFGLALYDKSGDNVESAPAAPNRFASNPRQSDYVNTSKTTINPSMQDKQAENLVKSLRNAKSIDDLDALIDDAKSLPESWKDTARSAYQERKRALQQTPVDAL